jgi:hypothetical protein
MEKTAVNPGARLASGLAVQGLGGLVGHSYGTAQKERGEKYRFGVPQAAGALLLPGGLGYQVGRYMAHKKDAKGAAKGAAKSK